MTFLPATSASDVRSAPSGKKRAIVYVDLFKYRHRVVFHLQLLRQVEEQPAPRTLCLRYVSASVIDTW